LTTKFGFSQRADQDWFYHQYDDETGECLAQWETGPIGPGYYDEFDVYHEGPSLPEPPDGNYMNSTSQSLTYTNFRSTAEFSFYSYGFGPLSILKRLPAGAEILQVTAIAYAGGVVRSVMNETNDVVTCDGPVEGSGSHSESTSLTGIGFSVLGFTSTESFEVIGSIAGASIAERVDITDIVNVMLAEQDTGKYIAYGMVMGEFAGGAPDVAGMLGGEGPRRESIVYTPWVCDPVSYPDPTGDAGYCPVPTEEYYTASHDWRSWDNLYLGEAWVRFRLPSGVKDWNLIAPRWPAGHEG
jgi:hypothetical protein